MQILAPLFGGGAGGAIASGAPVAQAAAGTGTATALQALQVLGTGLNIYGDLLGADIRSTQMGTQGIALQMNANAQAAEARMAASNATVEAAQMRAQAAGEGVAARAERVAAEQERVKGAEEANTIRRALLRNLASNRAAFGASGLDVASGSAAIGEVVASKEAGRSTKLTILDSASRARAREIEGGQRLIRKGMFEFGAGAAEAGAKSALSNADFIENQAGLIPGSVSASRSFVEAGGLLRASLSLADLTRSLLTR